MGYLLMVYKDKILLNIDVFHYILAHKVKQENRQRKEFTNFEIGVTYNINDRISISLGGSLSLTPMCLLRFSTGSNINNEPVTQYSSGVYNFGGNVGLRYGF